jgi:hypothetical protein
MSGAAPISQEIDASSGSNGPSPTHRAQKAGKKGIPAARAQQLCLSRLRVGMANIRSRRRAKLTTDQTRWFETTVIQELYVSEIGRQLAYKAAMRGEQAGSQVVAGLLPSGPICWWRRSSGSKTRA